MEKQDCKRPLQSRGFLPLICKTPGVGHQRKRAGLAALPLPGHSPQAAGAKHGPCCTDADDPRLIYLMSGYFHRLWWWLITLTSGVLIIPAWRQALASAQARRALAIFLMSLVTVPPPCGVRVGSQDPELCLKEPFLSPAVVTDGSSTLVTGSSRRHVLASRSVCKQAKPVLLYPADISTPGKNEHVSWPGAGPALARRCCPRTRGGLRSSLAPGCCAPPASHVPTPRRCEGNSRKYSTRYRLCLRWMRFKWSSLAGRGRMKSPHPGARRMLCPG